MTAKKLKTTLKMKKILLAVSLLAVSFSFVACGGDKESDESQKTIDSLKRENAVKDGLIAENDSLMSMLIEIDNSFAQLESEYVDLLKMDRKNPEASRQTIAERMAALQEAMAYNKEKINQLNGRIGTLNKQKKDLQDYVANLESRVILQEARIDSLRNELKISKEELENQKVVNKGLNQNVSDLTAANEAKDQLIAKQIADANRAWYIVGTYDELKEAGIVTKSGGFIGIGRTQGTVANMNTDKFTEIDRTKVTHITLNLKKPMLVTQHPEGSYEFVADEENKKVTAYLHILDPVKFWQNTNYLVISTK